MPAEAHVTVYVYSALVVQVLDGDTVRVELDLGLRIHSTQAVRVAGVDCPEVSTEAGRAARAYVRDLLPVGSPVTVRTQKPDKYGRVLGSITYDQDGVLHDLAEQLIAEGYAQPYDGGARA